MVFFCIWALIVEREVAFSLNEPLVERNVDIGGVNLDKALSVTQCDVVARGSSTR